MQNALVTGGCGFLGNWIVRSLRDRGVAVRVLALPNEPTDNLAGVNVEYIRGNVLDQEVCKAAVDGVDTVFHAAAIYKAWMPDPTAMYEVNLSGTFNVLEASRRAGVPRVVYTASIVSLGRPDVGALGDENTPYDCWSVDFAYSRSKYHSRVIAEGFAHWGLDVRVVCPGVVLGPHDIGPTPSGKLIVDLANENGPPIYTDGGANYVDVRDAAEAHVLAAERGKGGERYLATGHNLSNHQLMLAVAEALGKKRTFRKVPTAIARTLVSGLEFAAAKSGKEPLLTRSFLEHSLKASYYTNEKARRELGAKFRPIEDTLADAIDYFRSKGSIN